MKEWTGNPEAGTHLALIRKIASHFLPHLPNRLAVAVSGGGDSVALLHVLAQFCGSNNIQLAAVTVDHGLRPESGKEADDVASLAASLSVPHEILRWSDWDGAGNLQGRARQARYQMMTEWAKAREISLLALGHTADDQAETVVMRLARGSGVDGLSAMQSRRVENGVTLVRPMLDVSRAELRSYLEENSLSWVDDPSNEDLRFDRIKARQALDVLAPLGISVSVLTQVAEQMGQAREALDWHCFLAARDITSVNGGEIVIDLKKFRTLPAEIARRILMRAVMWVRGSEYAPRRKALVELIAAIRAGRSFTLDGCIVVCRKGTVWVCREYNAVKDTSAKPFKTWDNRWYLQAPDGEEKKRQSQDIVVRALGQRGLAQCPEWKETGRPRTVMLASPSVWRGDTLVSAPLAGRANGWQAVLSRSGEEFYAALLSH